MEPMEGYCGYCRHVLVLPREHWCRAGEEAKEKR